MAEETKKGFYEGHVKMTGKTWHGKEHVELVELPTPVTIEGVFHAFKSRHGDAINDLKVEKTTPEEFQKELNKEAAAEAKEEEKAYVKAQAESKSKKPG